MKKLFSLLFVIMFLFLGSGNVSAQENHASCQNFGLGTANIAQLGIIRDNNHLLATSNPNAISNDNELWLGILCTSRP